LTFKSQEEVVDICSQVKCLLLSQLYTHKVLICFTAETDFFLLLVKRYRCQYEFIFLMRFRSRKIVLGCIMSCKKDVISVNWYTKLVQRGLLLA